MFELLRQILFGVTDGSKSSLVSEEKVHDLKIQIATCALFIEIAEADGKISEQEMMKLIEIMKSTFNVDEKFVEELVELAKTSLKESVSVYEFTSQINDIFTNEEKFKILLNLWRLIFVDEVLDKYEDFMIKKIGGNLKMEHQRIIEAKLLVKEEIKRKQS